MIALITSMTLARAWPAHDATCDAQNVCVDGVSRERERETRRWKKGDWGTQLTWLYMRLNSLVSLFQASRSIDDVKGGVGPRVNPDLLQPGQVVQIVWISPSGNRLYNLIFILRNVLKRKKPPRYVFAESLLRTQLFNCSFSITVLYSISHDQGQSLNPIVTSSSHRFFRK